MAKMMAVALPVLAIGAAAFTGGTSLGLLGADAGLTGALSGADIAAGAGTEAASAAADATASFGATGSGLLGGATTLGSTVASATPWLKGAALLTQTAGTVMQARGAQAAGESEKSLANYEGAQLTQNADEQMAAAEQQDVQQNLATKYTLSNAAAAAAAGGGAVTDPSTQNVMQTIAGQGQLRAQTDLYNGAAQQQALLSKAAATEYGGQLAEQAGNTKMDTALLSGSTSLFDKYASLYD